MNGWFLLETLLFGNSKPKKEEWVIERKGKFWDGLAFISTKSKAKIFTSTRSAWTYVDKTFQEATAEQCDLERKKG